MPKESHKSLVEPSLADWLLNQLTQNPTIFELNQTDKILEKSELSEISVLINNKDGNNINKLIDLLELFSKNERRRENKELINRSIRTLINELCELRKNIKAHNVVINSALDGYTLNKTCRLIHLLDEYIGKLKKLASPQKLSPTQPGHKLKSQLFTQQQTSGGQNLSKDHQKLAEKLRLECEDIRSQIGSPEAMPRGLVITLAMCISHTFSETERISKELQNKIYFSLFDLLKNQEKLANALISLLKTSFATEEKFRKLLDHLEKDTIDVDSSLALIALIEDEKQSHEFFDKITNLLLDHTRLVGDKKFNQIVYGDKNKFEVTKELMLILNSELDHIRSNYPDLAEAGENLQRAFENAKIQP